MPHGEPIIDQTTHGLNFKTLKPPAEILKSYTAVLRTIYRPESYFQRVLDTALRLRRRPRYKPAPRELLRLLRAFFLVLKRLGFARATARPFWRTVAQVLVTRPAAMETAFVLMALYLHLGKRAAHVVPMMEARIRSLEGEASLAA
jgi:hypothetical protein